MFVGCPMVYTIQHFSGTQSAIEKACSIIKKKFPSLKIRSVEMGLPANPVIMPEIMQVKC